MAKILKPWKQYRPWFIIGENGGQVEFDRQWSGLSSVEMSDRSILDVGCAEGLVSLKCAEAGASVVHGLEKRERAVEVAQSLAGFHGVSDRVKFLQADLRDPDQALSQAGLLPQYDVVIANAVIQKVKSKAVYLMGRIMDKCASTLVIRLPVRSVATGKRTSVDPVTLAEKEGFHLEWESCGYPPGDPPYPPYPLDGEAWLAVFHRVNN